MVLKKNDVLSQVEERAARIRSIEETIDSELRQKYVFGQQLVIPVVVRSGDEGEMEKLMLRYREAGWRMDYNHEDHRGKEYVLVYASQDLKS